MALPTNEHHVHSDGYRSDKGDPDRDRMMRELADEIAEIPGVVDVWPDEDLDGPYVEVEYDGDYSTYEEIEAVADEWDCAVPSVSDDWLEVRG